MLKKDSNACEEHEHAITTVNTSLCWALAYHNKIIKMAFQNFAAALEICDLGQVDFNNLLL